jgi:hypothetical protein
MGMHHENPTQLLGFSSPSQILPKNKLLCMCYDKKGCMQWKWKHEWKVYKYLKHIPNKIKNLSIVASVVKPWIKHQKISNQQIIYIYIYNQRNSTSYG